jgi:low density lipoprotein receptor-related protein 5/6
MIPHSGKTFISPTYSVFYELRASFCVFSIIYWIDVGSRRSERVSIKRAFDNGTLIDRRLTGGKGKEATFAPFDLAIDPVARLMFWSCSHSNAINITRLDDEEDDSEGNVGTLVAAGTKDMPRSIVAYPQKSFVFWVNMASPVRIERALTDGRDRRDVVTASLGSPVDLVLDVEAERLVWADADLKRIDSCDLDGGARRTLVDVVFEPVAMAVHGEFIYWADRGQQTIFRADRKTGASQEKVSFITLLLYENAVFTKNVCIAS